MQFCQECGAEHQDWATVCVFCDGELGPVEPEPKVEPDHGTTDLDVSDLTADQLHHLDLLLVAEDLPFVGGPGRRTVPAVRADQAIELIDLASGTPDAGSADDGAPEGGGRHAGAPEDAEATDASSTGPVLATTMQRVWAQVVNWFGLSCLISIPFIPLAGLLGSATTVTQLAVFVLVGLAMTAVWGVDLGQFICRLQVVGPDGRAPGWRRAGQRVLVVDGPLIAYYAVVWLLYLLGVSFDDPLPAAFAWLVGLAAMVVWPIAVVVSIAQDTDFQGWHDRLAGTWVVSTKGERRGEVLRRARAEGVGLDRSVAGELTGGPADAPPLSGSGEVVG